MSNNFFDIFKKSEQTVAFILYHLNDMNKKLNIIYHLEQRFEYTKDLYLLEITSDNILSLIKNFSNKLNQYIFINNLKDPIDNLYAVEKNKDFFTQNDIIKIFSKIMDLLDVSTPFAPESLALNFNSYLKMAQRKSRHLNSFKDFFEQSGNILSYDFVNYMTTNFLNSATVNNQGANYLADQYGFKFPIDETFNSLLTIEEKRLTLSLLEFYNNWGGTIHELNQFLALIFKDYGDAWATVDEKNKTQIINIIFDKEPRKFLLDFWRTEGLLPPQKLGYRGKVILTNNIPIGFNNSFVNFQKNRAKLAFLKNPGGPVGLNFYPIEKVFAEEGDRKEIPDTPTKDEPNLSYLNGFGEAFEKDVQEGGAVIDRRYLNSFFYKLFDTYKKWQTDTMFEWDENIDYFTHPEDKQKQVFLRVKYQGRIFIRKFYDKKPTEEEQKTPPPNSSLWLEIDYRKALTKTKVKKFFDIFYKRGFIFHSLYFNPSYEKNKTYLRKSTDNKYYKINPTQIGVFNSGGIAYHDHEIKLQNNDFEHSHSNFLADWKYVETVKMGYIYILNYYGTEVYRGETDSGGEHSHEVYQINKEIKPPHPDTKEMSTYEIKSINFIYHNNVSLTFKRNEKFFSYNFYYAISSDYVRKIPNEDRKGVNFKEGFNRIYDNDIFSNLQSRGLDLQSFNGIIKTFTNFFYQAYFLGYIDWVYNSSYNYGARVKYRKNIYISLIDNNKTYPIDENYWLLEKDLFDNNNLNKNLKIYKDNFLCLMTFDLLKNKNSEFISITPEEGTPYVVNNKDIYNLVNTAYDPKSTEAKTYLPNINDLFIKTVPNLTEKDAPVVINSDIGNHVHLFEETTESGSHTHGLCAKKNDIHRCELGHSDGANFDTWYFLDRDDSCLHTHEITSTVKGEGDKVIPKNVNTYVNVYIGNTTE